MPKVRPERIAGIVALSYLVLIPAAGAYFYVKVRELSDDVDFLYDEGNLKQQERPSFFGLRLNKAGVGGS